MADRLEFSEPIERKVFLRQQGRCAVCGHDLNMLLRNTDMEAINYHHVVPAACGGDASEENCVALCTASKGTHRYYSCHYRVHAEGRYRSGMVAPPEYYEYSHGHNKLGHEAWVKRMHSRFHCFSET